jgi:hypothetical protein
MYGNPEPQAAAERMAAKISDVAGYIVRSIEYVSTFTLPAAHLYLP